MNALEIRLPAPPRRKTAFSMTPLADVMFQLLIFFMLSTSLAPYALIPLGGGTIAEGAPDPAAAPARPAGTPPPAIWQLGRGVVRIGGQLVALEDLADSARTARDSGVPEVVLFAASAATVQDMATALEVLRAARVPRVRLIGRSGAGG